MGTLMRSSMGAAMFGEEVVDGSFKKLPAANRTNSCYQKVRSRFKCRIGQPANFASPDT